MKMFTLAAATITAATAMFASPAFAQDSHSAPSQGHYEWRSSPQLGPRAPLRAPMRVWVPSQVAQADHSAKCDCAMMRGAAS